jgi:hypothetical protein
MVYKQTFGASVTFQEKRVGVGDFFKLWRRGQEIKEEMILCNIIFTHFFSQ